MYSSLPKMGVSFFSHTGGRNQHGCRNREQWRVRLGIPGAGQLNGPWQVAIGGDGSLYIADFNNGRIRKVASTEAGVSPLNGTSTPSPVVAARPRRKDRRRRRSPSAASPVWLWIPRPMKCTSPISIAIGCGSSRAGRTVGSDRRNRNQRLHGDQPDASQAGLYNPAHLHLKGILYIADFNNDRVRQVTTSGSPRPLVTVTGSTSGGFNGDGDPAIISQLSNPFAVATDSTGNLFITDYSDHRIREVLASNSTMQTVVGNHADLQGRRDWRTRRHESCDCRQLPAGRGWHQRSTIAVADHIDRDHANDVVRLRLHGSPEQYRPYGGQHHLRYDIDGAVGI